MYRRILVPLDGSARAERILPHVEGIAAKFGAAVTLLQVVEPIVPVSSAEVYTPSGDQLSERLSRAKEYLEAIQAKMRLRGIPAEVHLVSKAVVDGICETAEALQVDLIAMASHGRTGAARVFYGSVAAGVLNRVDRPLLIIRSRSGG